VWKEVIGKAVERPVDGTGREGGGPVGRHPVQSAQSVFGLTQSDLNPFLNPFSIRLNPISIRLSWRARSRSRLPANATNTEAMTKAFTAVTAASKLFSVDAIF
jgi:hypothetical protein